mmetsp:Transcript_40166/g.123697  ORF Transcript_40166/g.123697 Transcript_40166/m.123697 type:complete len:562 (-) Transcript_40166:166-1851(-)
MRPPIVSATRCVCAVVCRVWHRRVVRERRARVVPSFVHCACRARGFTVCGVSLHLRPDLRREALDFEQPEHERDAIAGGAVGVEGRPRAVDVEPRAFKVGVQVLPDEVASARDLRVAPVLDRILAVRDLGGELSAVELRRVRDRVDEVAGAPPRRDGGALGLLVVREDGGEVLPRRDHLRTGERRHVDDEVGRASARQQAGRGGDVRDAVREDEPALGVRVVDLARLAREEAEHVVVAEGRRPNRVLSEAEGAVQRRASGADGDRRLKGAEQPGGASHVGLHAAHALLWLEGEPSRVVHNPLADQANLLARTVRHVREDAQRRRLGRSLPDAVQSAVAALAQLVARDDLDEHLAALLAQPRRHRPRLLHEGRRRELLGRRVDQPCRQPHARRRFRARPVDAPGAVGDGGRAGGEADPHAPARLGRLAQLLLRVEREGASDSAGCASRVCRLLEDEEDGGAAALLGGVGRGGGDERGDRVRANRRIVPRAVLGQHGGDQRLGLAVCSGVHRACGAARVTGLDFTHKRLPEIHGHTGRKERRRQLEKRSLPPNNHRRGRFAQC